MRLVQPSEFNLTMRKISLFIAASLDPLVGRVIIESQL